MTPPTAKEIDAVAKAIAPNIWGDPDSGFFAMQPKGQSREVSAQIWENNARPYRDRARRQAVRAIAAVIELMGQ